jgi:hypothetical protein
MSEMHDILNRLQQLNESAQPVTEGKMPSKKHVMDMCKDGKSEKEMLEMHADADKDKLKDLIKTCKEEMKDSKQSAIAEGVARIEQRLLKEFAEFAEAKQDLDEGSMKHMMHADAERMSREEFVEKHGEEHGEFWDNIMGELDEGAIQAIAKHIPDIIQKPNKVRDLVYRPDELAKIQGVMRGRSGTKIPDEIPKPTERSSIETPFSKIKRQQDARIKEDPFEVYREQIANLKEQLAHLKQGQVEEGKAFPASGVRADKRGKYNSVHRDYYHVKLEKDNVTKAERVLADNGESESDVKSNAKRDNPGWKVVSVRKVDTTDDKQGTTSSHYRGRTKKIDVDEAQAKPDYLDLDGDGDKKEPMKKAASDKATSWKHEGDWTKSTRIKDGRGKATNLSDRARRETEKKQG